MSEPHWTGYVGMVTGIVGAITGIAGAIMGYVSYKKSNEIKSLDMRIELKKSKENFAIHLKQTEEFLPLANQSRIRVAAGTGKRLSGAMVQWKQEFESDQEDLKKIADEFSKLIKNYDELTPVELEEELLNIHRLRNRLSEIKDKYNSAFEEDNKERERIKNRHEPK